MLPVLREHRSITIQDRVHGQGKEGGSQMLKEENTEAGAEAKRQEDMSPKRSPPRSTNLKTTMTKNILLTREERA